MALKYLIDENVDPIYPTQIRMRKPELVIRVIGEPFIPPKGTKDPEILEWCEEYDFILVTNNRKSMPVHLKDHLQANRQIPGIFILSANLSVGQNIDELILIAECSFVNEYQIQIIHLPLTKIED
ncbi:DUF5615 family PIN-like protein [Lyngbya sp. CCAP 1446/10]|uniref:DUF5615 family PIN-like protein n=1 Tax=Lyngbya sp. CCAP 1446/10 TaxID=439293 RepID=UPI0022372EBA|nr:DUF5615 family PIN-like protein [Lyngbya sp. CCAP 1446/10]MCW6049603.1 DUF5615 family PIN-like protein [Lyngbya sp. CCAP 1446/10]